MNPSDVKPGLSEVCISNVKAALDVVLRCNIATRMNLEDGSRGFIRRLVQPPNNASDGSAKLLIFHTIFTTMIHHPPRTTSSPGVLHLAQHGGDSVGGQIDDFDAQHGGVEQKVTGLIEDNVGELHAVIPVDFLLDGHSTTELHIWQLLLGLLKFGVLRQRRFEEM